MSKELRTTTENAVNLCDSCTRRMPNCDSRIIIFGDGKGNDNVAACSIYSPLAQNKWASKSGWMDVDDVLHAKKEFEVWLRSVYGDEEKDFADKCLECDEQGIYLGSFYQNLFGAFVASRDSSVVDPAVFFMPDNNDLPRLVK